MKKTRLSKRIFAVLLAIIMVLTVTPIPVLAAGGEDGYSFDEETGKLTITTDAGMTSLIGALPNGIKSVEIGGEVTSIPNYLFIGKESLESVVISEGVTSIGNEAFNSCSNLKEVVIPSSITSFGYMVFTYCSKLTTVTIGNVTSIGNNTFDFCPSLTTVTVPNGTITANASTSGKVTIKPTSLTEFSITATAETGFEFESWEDVDGIADTTLSSTTYTMPPSAETVTLIANFGLEKKDVAMDITKDGVKDVDYSKSVELYKDGVREYTGTIASGTVTFTGVEYGDYDIYIDGEPTGRTITVDDNAITDTLDYYTVEFAVNNAGLASGSTIEATYDGEPIQSGDVVFGGKDLVITVTGAGADSYTYAWTGTGASGDTETLTKESLAETIDASCTVTGRAQIITGVGYSFDTKTGKLTITTDAATSSWRDDSDFALTEVKSAEICDGVENINAIAFLSCSNLESVVIPDGVISIGNSVFSGCSSLKTLIIPEGVTAIPYGAFSNCRSLKEVSIPSSVTTIDMTAFTECKSITIVHVPNATVSVMETLSYTGNAYISIKSTTSVFLLGESREGFGFVKWESSTNIANSKYASISYNIPGDENIGTVTFSASFEPLPTTLVITESIDGSTNTSSEKAITLEGETSTYTGINYEGVHVFTSVSEELYSIYIDGVDTGKTIAKSNTATNVELDYYTVQFSVSDARDAENSTISATYDSERITSGTVVLGGKELVITAEGAGADRYTYVWSGIEVNEDTGVITKENLSERIDARCVVTGSMNVVYYDSISLNPATSHTFPSAVAGYGDQTPLTVTVTNTGNRATSGYTIELLGDDSLCFDLSKIVTKSMAVGGTDTFLVTPKTGLSEGTYTAIVKVYRGSISKQLTVNFTVTEAGNSTPTPDTTPTKATEPEVEPVVAPTVEMVRVTPSVPTVIQGKTKSFTATVVGTEDASKDVTWSVEGNTSSSTVVSADGVLTVGKDEKATSIMVKATSKEDNTKSAYATVKVAPKKGTAFTAGNYTYIITDDSFDGTGTVTLTGVAKGKTVTTVNVPETAKYKGFEYDVTAIGEKAFYQNKNIKKATIGNNVTVIGKNSFRECPNLTEVTVGDSVVTISYGAFYKCTALKKITIGTGLQEIGNHAFCHDKALETIIISSTKLKKLGDHVLYANTKLTIKVPSSKVSAYEKLFTKTAQGKKVVVVKK